MVNDDVPNPSQGRHKDFGKSQFFKNLQVPPYSLQTTILGLGGGGGGLMALTKWAQKRLHMSPQMLQYLYCNQTMTQTNPRGGTRCLEQIKVSRICKCHQMAYMWQCQGF